MAQAPNVPGSGTEPLAVTAVLAIIFKEPVSPWMSGIEIDAVPVFVSLNAWRLLSVKPAARVRKSSIEEPVVGLNLRSVTR
jgi:hypothetical protein